MSQINESNIIYSQQLNYYSRYTRAHNPFLLQSLYYEINQVLPNISVDIMPVTKRKLQPMKENAFNQSETVQQKQLSFEIYYNELMKKIKSQIQNNEQQIMKQTNYEEMNEQNRDDRNVNDTGKQQVEKQLNLLSDQNINLLHHQIEQTQIFNIENQSLTVQVPIIFNVVHPQFLNEHRQIGMVQSIIYNQNKQINSFYQYEYKEANSNFDNQQQIKPSRNQIDQKQEDIVNNEQSIYYDKLQQPELISNPQNQISNQKKIDEKHSYVQNNQLNAQQKQDMERLQQINENFENRYNKPAQITNGQIQDQNQQKIIYKFKLKNKKPSEEDPNVKIKKVGFKQAFLKKQKDQNITRKNFSKIFIHNPPTNKLLFFDIKPTSIQ